MTVYVFCMFVLMRIRVYICYQKTCVRKMHYINSDVANVYPAMIQVFYDLVTMFEAIVSILRFFFKCFAIKYKMHKYIKSNISAIPKKVKKI